jgi:hypothetical protein
LPGAAAGKPPPLTKRSIKPADNVIYDLSILDGIADAVDTSYGAGGSWQGGSAKATWSLSPAAETYDGLRYLKARFPVSNGYFGIAFKKGPLNALLSDPDAKSVSLSFAYKLTNVTGDPDIISFGRSLWSSLFIGDWETYSVTYASAPPFLLLGVERTDFKSPISAGAAYFTQITYSVSYGN